MQGILCLYRKAKGKWRRTQKSFHLTWQELNGRMVARVDQKYSQHKNNRDVAGRSKNPKTPQMTAHRNRAKDGKW